MKTLQLDNVHATINYNKEQSVRSIEPPCINHPSAITLDNSAAFGAESNSDLPYELSQVCI